MQTGRGAFAALIVGLGAATGAWAQEMPETQNFEAFAAWQAQGTAYQTGVNEVHFVGAFDGPFYVLGPQGPQPAGRLTCPGLLRVDTVNGEQEGVGKCTITAEDGALAFANWVCRGTHTVSCSGLFEFTGGTDRLDGAQGGGQISIRSAIREFTLSPTGVVVGEQATGIAYFPSLELILP